MKKLLYVALVINSVYSVAKEYKITGMDGRHGTYDQENKTATLGKKDNVTHYTDVIEYSQAVTPPNISDPSLVPFATMPNPKYKHLAGKITGGQNKNITLWGRPSDENKETHHAIYERPIFRRLGANDNTFEIYGSKGMYDQGSQTAFLRNANGKKTNYYNVVEYRQAVTPPNIANKALKPFATMPNPNYQNMSQRMEGGQFKEIILYGIPGNNKNVSSQQNDKEFSSISTIADIE